LHGSQTTQDEAKRLNALTEQIIEAGIAVHRALGPGLLESAYEACLFHELVARGLKVERQKPLALIYEGIRVDCAYRMDLVVDGAVIVEVKSVAKLDRVHEAQILSYLKISRLCIGLVLNFNVTILTHGGIMRRVNGFPG
jgi:GxxExxY protein